MTRTLLTAVLSAALACAQNAPKGFDVATVKPNDGNDFRIVIALQPGGVFNATGVTLKMLMGQAYDVRDFQLIGGPAWIGTDRWDIKAKVVGAPAQLPPGEFRALLVNLIEDRFEVKTHRETREMPIYALTVAKGGSKMKENTSPDPDFSQPPPPPAGGGPGAPGGREFGGPGGAVPQGAMRMGRGLLEATGVPIDLLIRQLSQITGRPVINKSELNGKYDVKLTWTPEPGEGFGGPGGPPPPPGFGGGPGGPGGPGPVPAVDPNGPSLFTAIQEQLGLKLEPTKGPVEVVLIDHVERPSEN